MKKIFSFLLLTAIASVAVSAKDATPCPSGYYDNAINKSDQALLTALYNIISSHTNIGYDGLWSAYADTDTDENGYYIDMYSNYDRYTYSNKCGNYSVIGDCINREHSIPKSWWGGSKQDQYSDIFNIVPTDGKVNGQRSAYPYGECAGGTRLTNGNYVAKGRLGSSTFDGYSGTVFEPDDEYKGDFARAYFYMAACYNNVVSGWTSNNGSAMFAGNSYPVFTTYAINLLLSWHRLDPVSEKEITRNNYAYSWQDNRNPFIDHPELAEYIWGDMKGQAWQGDGSTVTTPLLSQPAAGTTINVGSIATNETSVSKQVTVKGANLTANVTVSVSGDGFSVSPSTLTANAVNNGTTVTLTYSGSEANATGSLTIGSNEVSRTVAVTASKATQGDDPDEPTGDYTVETWEGCATGGYWTKEVEGAAYTWYFSNAGIWAQSNDHWNGELGCRFGKTSSSSIAMQEDVNGTSGLSFLAATYGTTEADATVQVLYSTDGGGNWTLLKEFTLTHTLEKYTCGLDVKDKVRFKFQQTAGARMNIDDIAIYEPIEEEVIPQLYFSGVVETVTATQNGESSISEVTLIATDNENAITVTVDDNFELSLDRQVWATTLTLDKTGETFFVRLANTAATGEFEGTIAAVAGEVSAYSTVEGVVSAPEFVLGDVNMDGKIDVSDVTALISYILGNEVSPFNFMAGDMDSSQRLDVSDVTALISLILGSTGSKTLWNALPTRGGIAINNHAGATLEVFDLDANLRATVGTCQVIELPAGIYLVTDNYRSRKVVVK